MRLRRAPASTTVTQAVNALPGCLPWVGDVLASTVRICGSTRLRKWLTSRSSTFAAASRRSVRFEPASAGGRPNRAFAESRRQNDAVMALRRARRATRTLATGTSPEEVIDRLVEDRFGVAEPVCWSEYVPDGLLADLLAQPAEVGPERQWAERVVRARTKTGVFDWMPVPGAGAGFATGLPPGHARVLPSYRWIFPPGGA